MNEMIDSFAIQEEHGASESPLFFMTLSGLTMYEMHL
jgi:hypothetical protein